MATLPSGRTWATNDEPTAAQFNKDLKDAWAYFWNPPRVRVYRSTQQTVAGGLPANLTLLTWTSETFDTDGMFSGTVGTPSSRLTVVTAGIYEVCLHIEWEPVNNADAGHRMVCVNKNYNGATIVATSAEIGYDSAMIANNDSTGAPQTSHLTFLHPFSIGDYIEATAYNSGTPDTDTHWGSGAPNRSTFGMIWLGTV